MTTYVDFLPSANSIFRFQPTFDGEIYTVTTTWNLFGARWYVNIYSLAGTRIVTLPMIGSPSNYDISLTAGYFTSTLVWRPQNNQFEINP